MIFIHNFHKFPGKRFLFPVLLLTLVLTGCGKDKAVENYRANMTQFFENIQTIIQMMKTLGISCFRFLTVWINRFPRWLPLRCLTAFRVLPIWQQTQANI